MLENFNKVVKGAVIGDLHLPFQDDSALALVEKFLKDFQPDILVINGDLLDCFQISKYNRVPQKGMWFEDEINLGISVLSDIRQICPNAEIHLVEGNHEMRLRTYLIMKAPELYYSLSIPDKLQLEKFKIQWHGVDEYLSKFADNYIEIKGLLIGHFDKINQYAAYTAKNLVEKTKASLIQSHTHRLGVYNSRAISGKIYTGVENGCLCSMKAVYGGHKDWMTGFSIIYWTEDDYFIYPLMIKNNTLIYSDKIYET